MFRGEYSYVTKCERCGNVSAVDSQFYELELSVKDCPTLTHSLEEFFKVDYYTSFNIVYSILQIIRN